MVAPTLILLPGLDGTAALFDPFLAAAPSAFSMRPLPLPNDRPRNYRELADWVLTQLPAGPIALVAESFSGPLALMVADRCERVTSVVLCASFVEPPVAGVFGRIPKLFWKRPPPAALVRFFLAGGDRVLGEVVGRTIGALDPEITAARIEAVLSVNVTAELARYTRPLMFLDATQDRIIRSRAHQRARNIKPSAHFVQIEGPHLILQTRPVEAWRHIEPFLAGDGVCESG
ncbi:MAG TPA: alpha/beta hydrolase [Polyangia bacterium]